MGEGLEKGRVKIGKDDLIVKNYLIIVWYWKKFFFSLVFIYCYYFIFWYNDKSCMYNFNCLIG